MFEDNQKWLCVRRNAEGGIVDRFVVHGGIVPILQKWPTEYRLTYLGPELAKVGA